MSFLKKIMEWALEKEEELAKECTLKPEDVEKQIKVVEEKREILRKKCHEEDAEFGHVLEKLKAIKEEALHCNSKSKE
jgi:DNA-directed RNA polymerase sigma subunit (sigma70/sigma32)